MAVLPQYSSIGCDREFCHKLAVMKVFAAARCGLQMME
jgi:hypothetical protein